MTDTEKYIVDQIQAAEYLEDDIKISWIDRIKKDGLNPATTRLLLQTMLDHALAKLAKRADVTDPNFCSRYDALMADLDRTEAEFQQRAMQS